jgi:hypothetical protein
MMNSTPFWCIFCQSTWDWASGLEGTVILVAQRSIVKRALAAANVATGLGLSIALEWKRAIDVIILYVFAGILQFILSLRCGSV